MLILKIHRSSRISGVQWFNWLEHWDNQDGVFAILFFKLFFGWLFVSLTFIYLPWNISQDTSFLCSDIHCCWQNQVNVIPNHLPEPSIMLDIMHMIYCAERFYVLKIYRFFSLNSVSGMSTSPYYNLFSHCVHAFS